MNGISRVLILRVPCKCLEVEEVDREGEGGYQNSWKRNDSRQAQRADIAHVLFPASGDGCPTERWHGETGRRS